MDVRPDPAHAAPRPGGIDLRGAAPLASGAVRDVFAHPLRGDLLLKVWRPAKVEAFETKPGWLARVRRERTLGLHVGTLREWRAALRAQVRAERRGLPMPLARVGGLVPTTRGLALEVERVGDGADGLGRPLKALAKAGPLDDAALDALSTFAHALVRLGVNAPDLSLTNVVWDGAAGRFVMIDGYGEKTLIPLREWIPALNRRRVDEGMRRIAKRTGLRWDAARAVFERP
ncbi:hypothetical protein JQC91_11905 [Jannaschia sp. Os4]|uniref:YrbL family protein n=1 Tax=Jannaschia sp. Os4 TaxID=2807617 RepID=UPI001939E9B9|nr:YrbL family protein [Jannaschia sp. Os4]MBM2577002.1 hypothetical protein [Jannaschia sp. Os4]